MSQRVIIPGVNTSDPFMSSSSGTDIDAINASAVPLANSPASIVNSDSSAQGAYIGSLFGANWDDYKNFIMENTDKNNVWSANQADKANAFTERMSQITNEFNALEASKNRDWQLMMSNTAHQREVADLKAAGLNPVLSASGGNGASVTSGATASGVSGTGQKANADTSANSAIAQFYSSMISAQQQMYNANLSAKTNLTIAEKQIEAQKYIQQMQIGLGYAQIENQRYMAENYPTSLYGWLNTVFGDDNVSGSKVANNQWNKAVNDGMFLYDKAVIGATKQGKTNVSTMYNNKKKYGSIWTPANVEG